MFQSCRTGVSKLLYAGRCGRPRRGMIPGALSLTGVCVGAAYNLKGFSNGDAEILLSLSPPLRDYVSQSWQTLQQFPWLITQNHFATSGYFSSWFSTPGSTFTDFSARRYDSTVPPPKELNEVSGTESGNGFCTNGCLGRDSIANAASKVAPAVVNIDVLRGMYSSIRGSQGSGTIIDPDGTILTCAHLVADFRSPKVQAEGQIGVTLPDGRRFHAVLLHVDLPSDIAVIKLNTDGPLPAAKLGLSGKPVLGEWVLALCCPLSLENTLTAGIISCVDRKSGNLSLSLLNREKTDYPFNEDHSGGPLVNLNGEVIGVNCKNGSFAVPVEAVPSIIEQFRKHGRVVQPWLGAMVSGFNGRVTDDFKQKNPSFPTVSKGVLVNIVLKGSPAALAGLREGDVVIELQGVSVTNAKEFAEIIGDHFGKPLNFLVKRANGETVLLKVVLEEANFTR